MNRVAQLLRANAAFYDAFATHDIESMDELWARGVDVTCIHPGWPPLYGREEVMDSWRSILLGGEAPNIHCDEPRATRVDNVGLVTGFERIEDRLLAVCNAFIQQDGLWQIVHHQAGPVSPEAATVSLERTLN